MTKAYSFSEALVATARIYGKGNTQSHEQILGLKRSINKIERRLRVAVSSGNMLQTMKLALLLKEQSMKLQSEVDRFTSESVSSPDRNQRQFEETNGQRAIRVKAEKARRILPSLIK